MGNMEKPYWAAQLKNSSLGKGVFTEEMKQLVVARVKEKQKKKRNRPLVYIAVPLVALVLCLAVLPMMDDRLPGALLIKFPGASALETIDLEYASEADQNFRVVPSIVNGIKLDVHEVPADYKGLLSSPVLQRLPLAAVQIEEIYEGDSGTSLNYIKMVDGEGRNHFGFQLASDSASANGEFYEVGFGKLDEASFHESAAFGLAAYRMEGRCGAQINCVFWISANQEGVQVYFLNDAAAVYEQDLDGDGVSEVVVETLEQEVYLHKKIENEIKWVDVRAALGAEAGKAVVTYDPEAKLFQLNTQEWTKRYKYASGTDQLREVR